MSQGARTRSLTPPTEVHRLTDPKTSAYKQSAIRSYSSAERLKDNVSSLRSKRSDSTIRTAFRLEPCCSPQQSFAGTPIPSKEQDEKNSAMLAQFFSPTTRNMPPPKESVTEPGDFDETPLPSGRPSMSNITLEQVKRDVASSLSSATRNAAYRHALLRTTSGPVIVDKELPVPPILSRGSSPSSSMPQNDHTVFGHENNPSIPSRRYSVNNSRDSPGYLPQDHQLSGFTAKNDPAIHINESQAEAHHPRFLMDAEFLESGSPGQLKRDNKPVNNSVRASSPASSETDVISTQVPRVMTGGDLCMATVDVTIPKHRGHAHTTKIAAFDETKEPGITRDLHIGTASSPLRAGSPMVAASPVSEATQSGPSWISHEGHYHLSETQPSRHGSGVLRMGKEHTQTPETQLSCNEPCRVECNHAEKYFSIGSDTSLQQEHGNIQKSPTPSDNRSRAGTGTLDYKRTAQWLRDLLRYPEGYTTKLTDMPDKAKRRSPNPDAADENTELVSPGAQHSSSSSRRLTRASTLQPSKVDGNTFKQAFSDLERLLSEALAVASLVVPEESGPHRSDKDDLILMSPQDTDHHAYRSAPRIHRPGPRCHHDFPGEERNFTDVDLEDGDGRLQPTRHAASFPLPERPHLGDIVDSYRTMPLQREGIDTYDFAANCTDDQYRISKTRLVPSIQIPNRDSSKKQRATRRKKPSLIPSPSPSPKDPEVCSLDGLSDDVDIIDFSDQSNARKRATGRSTAKRPSRHLSHVTPRNTGEPSSLPDRDIAGRPLHQNRGISLRGRSHVSLRGVQRFSLAKSKKRQPIARDWSPIRKRSVAAVACISTALIGILLGIYAGLVPSIQYYIPDTTHATINGNVGCFLGMAIPTFFCWPLPLLHGRKPYIMSSLVLSMPLLFPQAIAVSSQRMQYINEWRMVLLAPRALMGVALGFASMNFHSILTDLFGASLMSGNPHQEVADTYDVRRHGGGMGVWLGIWTWCYIGSLGVGFLIGAAIIDQLQPAWGFYISIIIIAVVLLLNVLCPEVRRSAFRRSVAEVRTGTDISRRVARGEVMMHRVKTGPKWWGQEVYHGVMLSLEMLRQPGFFAIAVYSGWIYAQVVLIIVLLGSLTSRFYRMRSPYVGLMVASVAMGALVAIPFQKANIFSRARHHQVNTSRMTLKKKVTLTSHLLRRAVFCVGLPLAGAGYAIVSSGPPIHPIAPAIFAAAVGFLSCLAISECNGLMMESFDCSDLQPGMTGRPRGNSAKSQKRTNYSSFPRVTAGFAVCHSLGFVFAAGATALGGMAQRNLGQRAATGVVAGILLILTMILLLALIRFKEVQIIPVSKSFEMDKWTAARRESIKRRASAPKDTVDDTNPFADDEPWRPVLLGNPVSKTRRVNVLELGSLTRWTEIRKKNKLIDQGATAHLNRAALDMAADALEDEVGDIMRDAQELVRRMSQRSQSQLSRRGQHRSGTGSEGSGTPRRSPQPVEMEILKVTTTTAGAHPQVPAEVYMERECVMGQTVPEESEGEEDLVTDTSADEALARDHGSHMWVSKVMTMSEGKGKGKED